MIVIESKKKHIETLKKQYGDECVIIDVTSHADDEYQKFSPFYPHGGIPVPNSPGCLRRSKFSQQHRTKSVTHESANLNLAQN